MRTLTCDPNVEVRGEVMLSLLQNIQAKAIEEYVQRYGLTDVQEGYWYPIQPFLDLLNDLAANVNQTTNFVAIGMSVAATSVMPAELGQPSFEELVLHWDDHYQGNHRKGDIGYKTAEKLGDKHYKVTLHGGLYPDDFEYGVLYGFAQRFLPQGTDFIVEYDEDVQPLDSGGEKTVFIVEWE